MRSLERSLKETAMITLQHPIGSGFGAATTALEALGDTDLSGRTAVVTGGASGLGLVVARTLAQAGASVIIPVRDPGRARAALETIPGVESGSLDLMDPISIDAFAAEFLASGRPLDLLINSAGIMASPLARDGRGHESQFSTNHLGHFRLTARLWPALSRAKAARVVVFSSGGHQIAPVDFEDIDFQRRPYDKWVAYGQSKTANVLFAVELDRRGAAHGVRAFSLHPGSVLGPLARHLSADEIAAFNVHDAQGAVIVDPDRDLKTPEQGAATAIWCATSSRLAGLGGVYCENCDVARLAGEPSEGPGHGVKDWAVDAASAQRLWAISEDMTGVVFPEASGPAD
jgi:NAD(P)-dependent dehydrogenase (short-subunit alcohol dehydrogenase family)